MSQRTEELMEALQDDGLHALLKEHFHAAEVQLTASSGFLHEVMSAVTQETTAPERIHFPWRRALAGIAGVVAVLCGWAVYLATHAVRTTPVDSLRALFAWTAVDAGMACAGTALLLSLGIMAAALQTMGRIT